MTVDWAKLAIPFDPSDIKERPGAATWDHKPQCQGRGCRETRDATKHLQFSYVDARAVMQRLDDVLTPEGWDFQSSVIPGTDIVHGKLTIAGTIREDYGYPNSDNDDEPIKAASSDALKRCAVMYGIGRHLYDDNRTHRTPSRAPARSSSSAPAARSQGPGATPQAPGPAEPPLFDGTEFGNGHDDGGSASCPIHEVDWNGRPGDYWHKTDDGAYCRHPDNVRQPLATGARR